MVVSTPHWTEAPAKTRDAAIAGIENSMKEIAKAFPSGVNITAVKLYAIEFREGVEIWQTPNRTKQSAGWRVAIVISRR